MSDILRSKKAGIMRAPLGIGAPSWEELLDLSWREIELGARANRPGYRTVRKLLSDKRFDR